MTSAVIDASVTAPLILADEAGELSDSLLAVFADGQAVVPQHWRLEIANLGLMAVRKRRISIDELERGLKHLEAFQIVIDPDTGRSAWRQTLSLAAMHGLTSYDAAYLELARRRSLQLATRDGNLTKAAEREGVSLFPL